MSSEQDSEQRPTLTHAQTHQGHLCGDGGLGGIRGRLCELALRPQVLLLLALDLKACQNILT